MARILLQIDSPLSEAQLQDRLQQNGLKQEAMRDLLNYMRGLAAGTEAAVVEELVGLGAGGALASGTLTIAGNAAQSVTVNGVAFVGGTAYVIAAQTATQIAAAIAALINASTDSRLLAVTASSAAGVVTVQAKYPGAVGNLFTLAATGDAAASGANLAGGADAARVIYKFNQA
jgi:phage tail sheath gpL-like